MKEQPELTPQTKFCVLHIRESLFQSIVTDTYTFACLALMIYISIGSRFWTLITGLMAITYLVVKVRRTIDTKGNRFSSKKALLEWANNLPDDEKEAQP